MIEKKFCVDFNSNVSFLEYEIKENRIICEMEGWSLFLVLLWQQEAVNKLLKKHPEVILEIHYTNFDVVKEIKFTQAIDIWQGRNCSSQCCYCLNRVTCDEYKNMLDKEFKYMPKNDEQLYNLYLQVNAFASGIEGLNKDLREQINAKIEEGKGTLELKRIGLSLKINETQKDAFDFDIALKNNLLDKNNCNIKIGEFKKKIKGSEFEKKLYKVPFQKKLEITSGE